MSRSPAPRNLRSFGRIVLREMVILVPAAVIFAVYQGGSPEDWLISIGAVALLGLAFGWLMNERQKLAAKQMPRAAGRPAKMKRRR